MLFTNWELQIHTVPAVAETLADSLLAGTMFDTAGIWDGEREISTIISVILPEMSEVNRIIDRAITIGGNESEGYILVSVREVSAGLIECQTRDTFPLVSEILRVAGRVAA